MIDNTPLIADVELTPERCEYIAADTVRVTLKTNTGDLVTFSLKTTALLQLTNLSVALINGYTAQVFRDLDVF